MVVEKSLKYQIKPMKIAISGKAPFLKRSEIDFASEIGQQRIIKKNSGLNLYNEPL
jgi:hypothetical protein